MVIMCFWMGIIMILIGIFGIGISEIFTLTCFIIIGVSFVSGFYYIIDTKSKKTVNKEIKIHTNST